MAKIVVTPARSKTKAKAGSRSRAAVAEKRVRDAEGQMKTVRVLDASSKTFGRDLEYVFGKNVAKARRENKRVAGVADIAVAKR